MYRYFQLHLVFLSPTCGCKKSSLPEIVFAIDNGELTMASIRAAVWGVFSVYCMLLLVCFGKVGIFPFVVTGTATIQLHF